MTNTIFEQSLVSLIDEVHGINLPVTFADKHADKWDFSDCAKDTLSILHKGTQHPDYDEAWKDTLNNATFTDEKGAVFRLYEEGGLCVYPETITIDGNDFDMADLIDEMSSDFECGGYRSIDSEEIDVIMMDELSSDEYLLGCFNASFIADVTGVDMAAIEAMQGAKAYEAIGKLILSMGVMESLQDKYRRTDGYGHHFNHYDGSEIEFNGWYLFRTD